MKSCNNDLISRSIIYMLQTVKT